MRYAALSCALLLLASRAAGAAGSGDAGGHGQALALALLPAVPEERRGSGAAMQKVRALQQLRRAEWDARMQPLASLLEAYVARHRGCEAGEGMPGGAVLVRMPDDAKTGIGNQIPSIITGLRLAHVPCSLSAPVDLHTANRTVSLSQGKR